MALRRVPFWKTVEKQGRNQLAAQIKRYKSSVEKPEITSSASNSNIKREEPTRSRIPLNVPFPGISPIEHSTAIKDSYKTSVSTLENGIRVGSQPRFGQYATIGVAIKAGSRFETNFPLGMSHIIEKIGFVSSEKFPNRENIMQLLEKYGALCDSQSSRDTTVYAISTELSGLGPMMELLADVVFKPLVKEEEIQKARMAAMYELEDLQMKPDQEAVLIEMIHAAAWGNSNLGYSRLCPPGNADKITRDHILQYMKCHYTPSRIVVSGVGVDHKEFVDYTKEYFKDTEATWNKENIKINSPTSSDDSVACYAGGEMREEKDLGNFNAGHLPVPNLAHIAIGLESIPHSDNDFIPACVLNLMMGGGGSFSAGGPGKGMYSRLYTNVLNVHHWIYNATAYNNSYADSGLFCIYASSPPTHLKELVRILVNEFHAMAGKIDPEELDRAKTQLQSMLLMNLESRPVLFEDIGRQILAHGHYKSPMEYISQIEKVNLDDIQRLSSRILVNKPCVAALGNLTKLPSLEEITSYFANPSDSKSNFRLFRR